jgi:hypothetical protein
MLRLALILSLLCVASAAAAQIESRNGAGQRRVVLDMDADVIEGAVLTVPDVPVVRHHPRPTHKNLIQVRKSFSQELLASASKI